MIDIFTILLWLIFFVIPLVVFGLLIGRNLESRHLKELDAYDREHASFLLSDTELFESIDLDGPAPLLVAAEVVIGSDYLKTFLGSWKGIFGGEIRSFTTISQRAKREAIRRMVLAAESAGYNAICNVRVIGADVGGATSDRKNPMACCLASGTAYRRFVDL